MAGPAGMRPALPGRRAGLARRNGGRPMIGNRGIRRTLAVALMAAGALLMLLAPPVWIGAIPLGLGLLLELAGIRLERADR